MATQTNRPRGAGGAPQAPQPPWSIASVASIAAAGTIALVSMYLRRNDLFPVPNALQAVAEETYCYESVTTLADDVIDPVPRCFAVKDGRFVDVAPYDAQDTTKTASVLPGHVIPGLWDGHGHLIMYGESLASADLFGSSSAEDVRHRLHAYLTRYPEAGSVGKWLRGFGWDQMAMGGVMPSADIFAADPSLSSLYIMLDRVDAHCTWVSQAVLDLIPSDVLERPVPGGEIVRKPGFGVFCDNAMDLVTAKWPKPSRETKTEYIRLAMRAMRSMGLVGMHDAGVVPEDLQLYQDLVGGDSLATGWTMRVYAMVECPVRNTFCPEGVALMRHQEKESSFLSIRSVKLFGDGALGSWGSAMIDPYSDRPDMSGSLLVGAGTLRKVTRDWAQAGFQVSIHAIGDLANRYAVDAFEAALVELCAPGRPPAECQHDRFRFRIEHAQIIHPHDQARIHALGIVPSVQPTHATSDMAYAELRLGPGRTRDEAYRMRSFVRRHSPDFTTPISIPVLGSDFPIEPPDPFQGIYAAVARRSPHTGKSTNGTDDPWYPQEALSLDDALVGFTKGPAYAAFLDGQAGVIQAGAFADWVVLDRPLGEYSLDELRSIKVRETWVAGRRVYARE